MSTRAPSWIDPAVDLPSLSFGLCAWTSISLKGTGDQGPDLHWVQGGQQQVWWPWQLKPHDTHSSRLRHCRPSQSLPQSQAMGLVWAILRPDGAPTIRCYPHGNSCPSCPGPSLACGLCPFKLAECV